MNIVVRFGILGRDGICCVRGTELKEDIVLFEEWMDLYAHQIERFAFQNGCSSEQATQLTVEIFREIYNGEKRWMKESYRFIKLH